MWLVSSLVFARKFEITQIYRWNYYLFSGDIQVVLISLYLTNFFSWSEKWYLLLNKIWKIVRLRHCKALYLCFQSASCKVCSNLPYNGQCMSHFILAWRTIFKRKSKHCQFVNWKNILFYFSFIWLLMWISTFTKWLVLFPFLSPVFPCPMPFQTGCWCFLYLSVRALCILRVLNQWHSKSVNCKCFPSLFVFNFVFMWSSGHVEISFYILILPVFSVKISFISCLGSRFLP